MKTFILYGLKKPGERQCRYVGITSLPLNKRLLNHCCERGRNTHKERWIAQMFPAKPEIVPYFIGLTEEEACAYEVRVIAELRAEGRSLVNIAFGGRLPPGNAGRKASQQTRDKMSAARRGEKNPMFGRAFGPKGEKHPMFGKPAWNRGIKTPQHVRDKQSVVKLGDKNPRFRLRIKRVFGTFIL